MKLVKNIDNLIVFADFSTTNNCNSSLINLSLVKHFIGKCLYLHRRFKIKGDKTY